MAKLQFKRLEWLCSLVLPDKQEIDDIITDLLTKYERFLEKTDHAEDVLIGNFLDKTKRDEYRRDASEFGDAVFAAMRKIGEGNQFYRLLVV